MMTTPRRPQLTLEEHTTAALLHKRGHTHAQIAKAIGASPATVKRCIDEAKTLLGAYAGKAAADWIHASALASRNGDHRPAKDLLTHTGVVTPPLPDVQTGGIKIQFIGISLPGIPPQHAPEVIDVVATPTPSLAKVEGRSEGRQIQAQNSTGPIMAVMSAGAVAVSD